jgi:hypothetical protein
VAAKQQEHTNRKADENVGSLGLSQKKHWVQLTEEDLRATHKLATKDVDGPNHERRKTAGLGGGAGLFWRSPSFCALT